ncbi:MAG: phosphonate ABC transporter, permease protein PhnE [Halobaculum sp.]
MSTADGPFQRLLRYFGLTGRRADGTPEARLARLKRQKTIRRVGWLVALTVFARVFLLSLNAVEFSVQELIRFFPEFQEALVGYFPPTTYFGVPFVDVGRYWAFVTGQDLFGEALITLGMGFAGTVLGAPLALLFGVLGSERVVPFPFNFLFRGTMSVIRAIPALVWALIFIPLGGVSSFTATLAIGMDTIGNLGRLFTDELEEIEDGPIEAIRSTGANGPQTVTFGMLSQVFRPFIAWIMYILEINTRIAVGLGIIGAGGLGLTLQIQRGTFAYTNMMATIFVIVALVISVEIVSQRTRSYLRPGETERLSLLELIIGAPRRIVESLAK